MPLGVVDAPDLDDPASEDPAQHVLRVAAPLHALDGVRAREEVRQLQRVHVADEEAEGGSGGEEAAVGREVRIAALLKRIRELDARARHAQAQEAQPRARKEIC